MKCRKNTEIKNPKVAKPKNGRIILLSKCAVCNSKKSKFIKQQEASGLLSSLGIKAPFKKNSFINSSFVWEILTSRYKIQNERNIKQVFISRR